MLIKNSRLIIEAVFDYLETTGIEIGEHKFTIDTLRKNNCTVTDDLFAKVPKEVSLKALSTVPKSFKWWNRAGDDYVEYGKKGTKCVIGDMRAPFFVNPKTSKIEPATSEALIESIKLLNHLPNIDVVGNMIATDDYIRDSADVICNSEKPVMLGAGNFGLHMKKIIDMGSGC